jgi:hypothetical protein
MFADSCIPIDAVSQALDEDNHTQEHYYITLHYSAAAAAFALATTGVAIIIVVIRARVGRTRARVV